MCSIKSKVWKIRSVSGWDLLWGMYKKRKSAVGRSRIRRMNEKGKARLELR